MTWFLLPPTTTPDGQPIPIHVPWVETSRGTEHGFISADFLRFLALTHDDPEDPERLMARRVRKEHGVSKPRPTLNKKALRAELLRLLDEHEEDE